MDQGRKKKIRAILKVFFIAGLVWRWMPVLVAKDGAIEKEEEKKSVDGNREK